MFARRKARKIQVSEDNDEPAALPDSAPEEPLDDAPPAISPSAVKFTRRTTKSSSLRKSINISDDTDAATGAPAAHDVDDHDARPTVIRPVVSRSGSTNLNKGSLSRLSFGATEDAGDARPFTTPKKNPAAVTLTQRAAENSALRASASTRQLPMRSFGAQAERPAYSRELLEELQSSTPNTPAHHDALSIHDDDAAMSLDPSELDGAVVVPSAAAAAPSHHHRIPTATEIRAKKERRARLAQEGDAYASDADGGGGGGGGGGYISLLPAQTHKKKAVDTRLVAEDEDLGEGYDEFVEDGRLELDGGRRSAGDSAARRRQQQQQQRRREMAALIATAEGASDEGGDSDSDAERKAAYEAAQTRAAMDGLRALGAGAEAAAGAAAGVGRLVIPKIKPLPELEGSLARVRELVRGMEEQVAARRSRIAAVEREKQEILEREREVQEVLDEAGSKYQAAMGIKSEQPLNAEALVAQSPMGNPSGLGAGERGLESFGTPTRVAEEDGDVKMED